MSILSCVRAVAESRILALMLCARSLAWVFVVVVVDITDSMTVRWEGMLSFVCEIIRPVPCQSTLYREVEGIYFKTASRKATVISLRLTVSVLPMTCLVLGDLCLAGSGGAAVGAGAGRFAIAVMLGVELSVCESCDVWELGILEGAGGFTSSRALAILLVGCEVE